MFLILALVIGQAYACPGNWVLPDGRDCQTCATETCVVGSPAACKQKDATLDSGTGSDCHSCCSLKACDEHGSKKAVAQSQQLHMVMALTGHEVEVLPCPDFEPRAVHVQIEQGFPNAPPSDAASRAPPSS